MEDKKKGKEVQTEPEHMEHFLIPRHRVLSEEEREEFLQKNNLTVVSLPIISSSDVIVKQIGAKSGDILEIKRKSSTAGESLYYRYVVS